MQGTAADIVKMAMVAVDHQIRTGQIRAKLLLQVHDELVLEVRESEAPTVAAQVKAVMEGVASFSIPLEVEAKWAKNWSDAH